MPEVKKFETTAEHFEIFKVQVLKEVERFGLKNWRIDIWHEELEDCRAEYRADHAGKAAVISLNTTWREEAPNEDKLRLTAFHEVMELLISPLSTMAVQATSEAWRVDVVEKKHEIIRTLENVVGYAE